MIVNLQRDFTESSSRIDEAAENGNYFNELCTEWNKYNCAADYTNGCISRLRSCHLLSYSFSLALLKRPCL